MTALGKVVRTTAFKLSVIYFAVFSIFAVAFVLYLSWNTNALLEAQLKDTIEAEIRGLAEQGRSGGLAAIFQTIEQRSHTPGASLYLITDVNGRILTGNISQVPADLFERSGMGMITVPYERNLGEGPQHFAMVQVLRLPGGFWMLVGRDIGEREEFRQIIGRALIWAVALLIGLALVSWFFVSRRVLKRIDSVAVTSRRIMAGDLSRRLEVTGTGDEFDRLANSLNAMLERIEHLLLQLRDVSDNIAHDLKTPLTRLRNRVEAALAGPPSDEAYRTALVATIEESDRLIQTFNALLMIARIEAGPPDGAMTEVEAGGNRPRRGGALRAGGGGEGRRARGGDARADHASRRTANCSARRSPISSTTRSSTGCPRATEGPLRIVMSTAREGNDLVLRVADNGVGVPEADRARVLQRFVRLEKSRSTAGSGLGLSLVNAVVAFHNGTIELADNNPGWW